MMAGVRTPQILTLTATCLLSGEGFAGSKGSRGATLCQSGRPSLSHCNIGLAKGFRPGGYVLAMRVRQRLTATPAQIGLDGQV